MKCKRMLLEGRLSVGGGRGGGQTLSFILVELESDICLDVEAGHSSYMDELPPKITDSHPNRSKFLASLANDVGRFVIG